MRHIITALLACAAITGVAAGDQPGGSAAQAHIAGVEWQSILPTGEGQPSVRVAPFQLDRTPVTNGQYLAFVRKHPQWQRGRVPDALADEGYLKHWQGAVQLGSTAGAEQPVTAVSWFAARAFCEARGSRLPTWYEWELAAAADDKQKDARNSAGWSQRILGWYAKPSNAPLALVGREPPNAYGVHDLHGLVWEWVEDFNALMLSGDSRERGDPDQLKFCGSGATAFQNPDDYAIAMRLALLSSLEAKSTTRNLGFRCASDAPMAKSVAASDWPADSVFHVNPKLETSQGHRIDFAATGGRVQIATMFYASCPMACPLIIDTLKNVEAALPAPERNKLGVLMVTVDPANDTPQVLSALAEQRHIADPRWVLARASDSDTRRLAAVLGVQYRALGAADFDHSSTMLLLDALGRPLARSNKLGKPDPAFITAVHKALQER